MFKFHTSEGGLRVPIIIAGPAIAAGQKFDAAAFVTDVTPTLLDFAGSAPLPATLDGVSLRPALGGAAATAERSIVVEVAGNIAYYQGPYKLVRSPAHGTTRAGGCSTSCKTPARRMTSASKTLSACKP